MKIFNKTGGVIADYPKAKSHEEVLIQGLKDNIRFINADLSRMELRNLELGGIRLDGAKCIGTDFSGTDFKGKVYRSDLSFTNFTGANFTGANLKGVELMESNFTGATMVDANLTLANCEDTNFSDAILKGATFTNAGLYDAIGNGREMIRIDTEQYNIVITKDIVQIGCKGYTLEEWLSFSNKKIKSFDNTNDSLAWWKEWRPKIEGLKVANS